MFLAEAARVSDEAKLHRIADVLHARMPLARVGMRDADSFS